MWEVGGGGETDGQTGTEITQTLPPIITYRYILFTYCTAPVKEHIPFVIIANDLTRNSARIPLRLTPLAQIPKSILTTCPMLGSPFLC